MYVKLIFSDYIVRASLFLDSNCTFSFLPQEPMSPYAEYTGGLTRSCLGNRQCLLGYYAAVTAMDKNIGRLIDTLKNLGTSL